MLVGPCWGLVCGIAVFHKDFGVLLYRCSHVFVAPSCLPASCPAVRVDKNGCHRPSADKGIQSSSQEPLTEHAMKGEGKGHGCFFRADSFVFPRSEEWRSFGARWGFASQTTALFSQQAA